MIVFGPVPSRRLGRSLGINNIPPKRCTYSCVYCQLGRTITRQLDRTSFYPQQVLVEQVQGKVRQTELRGERIDALTFVPDGEPTLDQNLESEILQLRPLGYRVAVISNASLIWREDVRSALNKADWVSLKVDAVDERLWRQIDRPCASLKLASILDGMLTFASRFDGQLVTETMPVRDLNDQAPAVRSLARFLQELRPAVAYLSVPTRPPAEPSVRLPEADALTRAFHIISERVPRTEYLIGYEGDAFSATGDLQEDLLSITSVHPMRREAVESLVRKAHGSWSDVESLIERGQLVVTLHEGHTYYLRQFSKI